MKVVSVVRISWLAGVAFLFSPLLHASDLEFAPPVCLDVPGVGDLEGPEVVDYDGDGQLDLLSGLYSGHLLFRRNNGSNEAPNYAEPVKLKRSGEDIKLKHW
jgi:hypothetical protein